MEAKQRKGCFHEQQKLRRMQKTERNRDERTELDYNGEFVREGE